MTAKHTQLTTADGLAIYDLDHSAAELWAVAGPAGYDHDSLDPDSLPAGFRWVTDEEWCAAVAARTC